MARSNEELEQSLRAEVQNYINGHLAGQREEIERLQSQVNEAFTRLSERLSSAESSDASIAVTIAEHLRDARAEGTDDAALESSRARSTSDMALLKAAVDDLDSQRTQADILNTLVNRASSFAPRVAFFVVKNDRATGWRARGLEGTIGDDAIRELSLPLSDHTLLSEAAHSRATWSGTPGSQTDDHELLNKFGGEPPQRMVAIPLIAREKTVAVLYADSAALEPDAINLEALETLVRVAGMVVELLAQKRPVPTTAPAAAQQAPESSATHDTHAHAPQHVDVEATIAPAAAPPPPAATQVEELTPKEAPMATATQAEFAAEPSVEHYAEPVAAATAPEMNDRAAAPAVASSAPLGTARRYGSSDADLPIEVSDDERRYHHDARRFARLLVSEIKLYNEQKVRDGREAGNLYERLREEIDRSRQMYDKRVAPNVATRYDYFHHELVNTLAEGDPNKLGSDYPGATASA